MLSSREGMPTLRRTPAGEHDGPNGPQWRSPQPPMPLLLSLGPRIIRRLRLWALVRRRDERVRILRYQTAELRMVPSSKFRRPTPSIFVCPTCSKNEDMRLLMIELRAKRPQFQPKSRNPRKPEERPRILLRLTRRQLEDIRADFEARARRPPGFGTGPDSRSDREIVVSSLVP
jgi:hypothetical protein